MAQEKRVSIIVAIGKNRAIGKDNQLLWRIPDDLKRFKALTAGHPVIMGRKTWESLPEKFRPLPERTNVIVTRQTGYAIVGAVVAHSLAEALNVARVAHGCEEIFIIGGAQLYAEALPFADRLYVTLIDDEKDADSYFPAYEQLFTKVLKEEACVWNGLEYRWIDLERA